MNYTILSEDEKFSITAKIYEDGTIFLMFESKEKGGVDSIKTDLRTLKRLVGYLEEEII